jgi:hypothetical protein
MKTKEEIEELAENKFNEKYYPISKKGFIDGYTQCQEDIRKIWQNFTISEKAYFIESLNKKD